MNNTHILAYSLLILLIFLLNKNKTMVYFVKCNYVLIIGPDDEFLNHFSNT